MNDKNEIDKIAFAFFNLFNNKDGNEIFLNNIKSLFIEGGLIINNTSGTPILYDLDSFIKPRQELLTNGSLVNFFEQEIESSTEVFGNIAHRICLYEKSGIMEGKQLSDNGVKLMNFVKMGNKWFISSVLWSDR